MIRVDRLVLDIPGMTAARAEPLGRAIGTMIEGSGPRSRRRLEVMLPPGAAPSDRAILAAVAAALKTGAG